MLRINSLFILNVCHSMQKNGRSVSVPVRVDIIDHCNINGGFTDAMIAKYFDRTFTVKLSSTLVLYTGDQFYDHV